MRTAIAYLTSLVCHGAVLIPLTQLPAWSDTPPRYSMQGGGPAAPSLRASLAAPDDGGDLDDAPVLVAAMPRYGQADSELQPEPALTVLPETKVLARAKPNVAAPELGDAAGSSKSVKDAAGQANRAGKGEPTGAMSPKALSGDAAGSSTSVKDTIGQADRAARATRRVGTGRPGSTGADAVTAAGSAGNSGGGQVDQAASPAASNPVPPYPPDALAGGIEGLVLLRVRIGADGAVEEAAVHQSSGTPSLDESALSTVRRQWRFQPATRCGLAVSYEAILPIRFTIRAG